MIPRFDPASHLEPGRDENEVIPIGARSSSAEELRDR